MPKKRKPKRKKDPTFKSKQRLLPLKSVLNISVGDALINEGHRFLELAGTGPQSEIRENLVSGIDAILQGSALWQADLARRLHESGHINDTEFQTTLNQALDQFNGADTPDESTTRTEAEKYIILDDGTKMWI